MPHYSFLVDAGGPLLVTHIGVSGPRLQALVGANQALPSPQQARMLVDTGASHTSIDHKFVGLLGLSPTGSVNVLTPSTGAVPHVMPSYDVALYFIGLNNAAHSIGVHSVTACDLSAQGIDGLIGRDILANASLTYFGPGSMCHLSF